MRIWPIFNRGALKKAFAKRQEEFCYRIAADPMTTDLRIRKLKNGSTVYARYTDRFENPYADDVFIFRPNLSIETKSYHRIKEAKSQESAVIGTTITKQFFKNNSYAPHKTESKTVWKWA